MNEIPTYNDLKKKIKRLERELTDCKQAEENARMEIQLHQDNKKKDFEILAEIVIHEFNNILGTIIGYAEMMALFDIPKDSPIRSRLDGVLKGAYRAKDLVQQILTFSRQSRQ